MEMENNENNNLSAEQKKKLIEFIRQNEELRSGSYTLTFTFADLQRCWEEIATELNSLPGQQRDWRQWRKTWQDLKKSVENKNKKMKSTDGGNSSSQITLTEDEENILELIESSGTRSSDSVIGDSDLENDDFEHDSLVTESTSTRALAQQRNIPTLSLRNETSSSLNNQNNQRRNRSQSSRRRTIIMCSNICRRKLSIKKHYYEQKLRLMAREVRAKERIAAALELIANRNFNS